MATFTDDFERADGPLGPAWTDGPPINGLTIINAIDSGAYVAGDGTLGDTIGSIATTASYPGDQFVEGVFSNFFQGHDPGQSEHAQYVEAEIYLLTQVNDDGSCLGVWILVSAANNPEADCYGQLVSIDASGNLSYYGDGSFEPLTDWRDNPPYTFRLETSAAGHCKFFFEGHLVAEDDLPPTGGEHVGAGAYWYLTHYGGTFEHPGDAVRLESITGGGTAPPGTGWYLGLVVAAGPPITPPPPTCPDAWMTWHPATTLASSQSAGTAPMDLSYAARTDTGGFDSIIDMLCDATMAQCDESWFETNLDWGPIHAIAADMQATGRSQVAGGLNSYDVDIIVSYTFNLFSFRFEMQYTISKTFAPGPGDLYYESWMTDFEVNRNPWSSGSGPLPIDSDVTTSNSWIGNLGDQVVAYPGYEPPLLQFIEHQFAVPSLSGNYDITWEMNWDSDPAVHANWTPPSDSPLQGPIGGTMTTYFDSGGAHIASVDALRLGDVITSCGAWTGAGWTGSGPL